MATRLNYTGRKKLALDTLGIRIHPADGAPATFDVDLTLDDLRPGHDAACVFVEAYRQSTRMRFDWGTVGHLTPPAPEARRLTDFEDWRRVLFRIKITNATDDPGRLIAWRNRIKPKGPQDEPESDLLYFENADLEGRVWDLRWGDDMGPVVQIDNRAGDRHDVGGDPKFQAAVFPEIMRRALTRAFITEKENGEYGDEHWSATWLQGFLKPQLKLPDPPPLDEDDPSERMEWIEQAVRTFARHHSFARQWNPDSEEQS